MYLLKCVPTEDSNQPVHPHRLIRVFSVSMKTLRPWLSKMRLAKILIRLRMQFDQGFRYPFTESLNITETV